MAFNMDDYVDVAERIRLFREKHPDGSLQSEISLSADGTWVLATAWAYRDRVDTRPGMGHSRLTIPGKTPYTKDSEVENAETSAWGRAIVAALAADTKKIASAQEVGARHGSGGEPSAASTSAPNAGPSRRPSRSATRDEQASSPVPSPAPGGAAISPASSTVPENTPAAPVQAAKEEVELLTAPSSPPGSQFTPPAKAQAKIKQRETEKEGAKAPASDSQVAELKGIVKTGVVTYPQVEEMLAAYGVSKFWELQVGEAQELLGKLERLSRNAGKAA